MKKYLLSEIARREAEIQSIGARKGVLEIELGMLRQILAEADAEPDPSTEAAPPPSRPASEGGREKIPGANMSERWLCLTRAAVERYPDVTRNDDVQGIQRAAGQQPANREGIRSHVSTFANAGLYEKVSRGSFRATELAAQLVGVPLGSRFKPPHGNGESLSGHHSEDTQE